MNKKITILALLVVVGSVQASGSGVRALSGAGKALFAVKHVPSRIALSGRVFSTTSGQDDGSDKKSWLENEIQSKKKTLSYSRGEEPWSTEFDRMNILSLEYDLHRAQQLLIISAGLKELADRVKGPNFVSKRAMCDQLVRSFAQTLLATVEVKAEADQYQNKKSSDKN